MAVRAEMRKGLLLLLFLGLALCYQVNGRDFTLTSFGKMSRQHEETTVAPKDELQEQPQDVEFGREGNAYGLYSTHSQPQTSNPSFLNEKYPATTTTAQSTNTQYGNDDDTYLNNAEDPYRSKQATPKSLAGSSYTTRAFTQNDQFDDQRPKYTSLGWNSNSDKTTTTSPQTRTSYIPHGNNKGNEQEEQLFDQHQQQHRVGKPLYRKNDNSYEFRQQGMSDTRFLDNGRYFYDLDKENTDRRYSNNPEFNQDNSDFEFEPFSEVQDSNP